jgi:hypothetical protein
MIKFIVFVGYDIPTHKKVTKKINKYFLQDSVTFLIE